MVIKASSSVEIRRLVEALGSPDDVQRETAIARLSIIGSRAVDRLVAAYNAAADRDARIAVLRALESIGDRRAIVVARTAIARGGDEALAAVAAVRGLLDSPHAPTAADALDTLLSVAVDAAAGRRLRLAAFDSLQQMPQAVRDRVAAALQSDADPDIQAAVAGPAGGDRGRRPAAGGGIRKRIDADAIWADALDGHLPDDAGLLRDVVQARGASVALSSLQKLIDVVRGHEQRARPAARRADWQALRGALHQALAFRGSKIAVYDLRETLDEGAGPLPVSFLAALHVVGDPSCLPPLAAAYARAQPDSPWRQQVAAAFHAIAKRERISKRHAVMKRIAAKWPEILAGK
jgi:hypothetical protein